MYKKPIMLNSRIYEVYSNYFVFNLFMLSLGDYIFLKDVFKSNFWAIFNIILFSILLIFPYNNLLSIDLIKINEADLKANELYEDSFYNYFNDYERNNPITKNEGIKHFLDKLLQKVLISQQDYNNILENYENMNLLEIYYKSKLNLGSNLLKRIFSLNFLKNKNNKKEDIISRYKKYPFAKKILNPFIKKKTLVKNSKDSDNTKVKEEQTKPSDLYIYKRSATKKSSSSNSYLNCINLNLNNSNNNIKIFIRKNSQIKKSKFKDKKKKRIMLKKDMKKLEQNKNSKRKFVLSKIFTIENEEAVN